MYWWQALLLGLVQGFTEFLPVSSSGHLMLIRELLGVNAEHFWDFTMTVHLATVLSIICVFYKEIFSLLRGLLAFKYNKETDYVFKIVISVIPAAAIALSFKHVLDEIFEGSLIVVAFSLLITAFLLLLSELISKKNIAKSTNLKRHKSLNELSYVQAFIIGIAQAFAILPGLSRSGSTIATGLLLGIKRSVVAQFSFMMVIIPIVGEQLLSVLKSTGEASGLSFTTLAIAFISAFVSGLFACKLMISLVKKASLLYFSIYCVVIAAIIFILF